jgi:hypothetical protein
VFQLKGKAVDQETSLHARLKEKVPLLLLSLLRLLAVQAVGTPRQRMTATSLERLLLSLVQFMGCLLPLLQKDHKAQVQCPRPLQALLV